MQLSRRRCSTSVAPETRMCKTAHNNSKSGTSLDGLKYFVTTSLNVPTEKLCRPKMQSEKTNRVRDYASNLQWKKLVMSLSAQSLQFRSMVWANFHVPKTRRKTYIFLSFEGFGCTMSALIAKLRSLPGKNSSSRQRNILFVRKPKMTLNQHALFVVANRSQSKIG